MRAFISILMAAAAATAWAQLNTRIAPMPESQQHTPGQCSPQRVEAAEPFEATHFIVADSPYDSHKNFSLDTHNYDGNGVNVDLPYLDESGKAYITGIYSFPGKTVTEWTALVGQYDADTHIVTLYTPGELGQLCGRYDMWDDPYEGYLIGVKLNDTPEADGSYGMTYTGQVRFQVNDDNTLTALDQYVIYALSDYYSGILTMYTSATMSPVCEQAKLSSPNDTLSFGEGTVFVNTDATQSMTLFNTGLEDCDINILFDGPNGLTVKGAGTIKAASANKYDVTVNSTEPGEKNWTMTFVNKKNGENTVPVNVTANVLTSLDYSKVITRGDMDIVPFTQRGVQYPTFAIEDGPQGFPVAASKHGETSGITAKCEVPEGKIGVLSWKGLSHTLLPNGFSVWRDGDTEYAFDETMEDGVARSSNNGIRKQAPECWLTATFIVPEASKTTLFWEAFNSSADPINMFGQEAVISGTFIYLDGVQIAQFGGESNACSVDVDEDLLTVGPGMHTLKFEYKRQGDIVGEDCVKLTCLGYTTTTGMESIAQEAISFVTEYYNLQGVRLSEPPASGIFIQRTADGTASVCVR